MYVIVREFSYFWMLYRTKFEPANLEQAQLVDLGHVQKMNTCSLLPEA